MKSVTLRRLPHLFCQQVGILSCVFANHCTMSTMEPHTSVCRPSDHEQVVLQQASKPRFVPRVLRVVPGSGPFGEQVNDAKFYTLDAHPPSLTLAPAAAKGDAAATRKNIDVGPGGLAFVVDNILSPKEADELVALSETMGYSRFAPMLSTPPGMRQNYAAHWFATEQTAALFLEPMFARFQHLLPTELDGEPLHPRLSHRLAHYKYSSGDVFNVHTDGSWPGQQVNARGDGISEWHGVASKLSMLLYLSDVDDGVQGGDTRLYRADYSRPRAALPGEGDAVDVAPRKGSALFFRHGFGHDSVLHAGRPVGDGAPKYVVRLNVLYGTGN